MRAGEGDWVKHRSSQGWVAKGKALEVRPDDKLIVGTHDGDPSPVVLDRDKVVGRL